MQITGENLKTLAYALGLALDEIHNQIATCPDVIQYAEDIEVLEEDQRKLQRLLDRVNRHLPLAAE